MTVSPVGIFGNSFTSVVNLFANCAEIQTMLGVGSAAAATPLIQYGRSHGVITPPAVFVNIHKIERPQIALDTWGLQCDVAAWIAWPFAPMAQVGDTSLDKFMRALNRADMINYQMRALVATNDPTLPARLDELEFLTPRMCADDDTELKGCFELGITFTSIWK